MFATSKRMITRSNITNIEINSIKRKDKYGELVLSGKSSAFLIMH